MIVIAVIFSESIPPSALRGSGSWLALKTSLWGGRDQRHIARCGHLEAGASGLVGS